MRLSSFLSIFFVFLLYGAAARSVNHQQHRPTHVHGTLGYYILQKLYSIVQWLDSRSDSTVFDYIYRVNEGAGLNLYQGDIEGYKPRIKHVRSATTHHESLWNTRTVPYVIDPVFDNRETEDIHAAIQQYHKHTCIHFVPRTTEADYIRFVKKNGCYSKIGRNGGEQNISLVAPCLRMGTVIHEIMHALGFFHEQSRPDRDAWVDIIYNNIEPGKEHNFEKQTKDEVDTLGVLYDYGSVMHYSKTAFTRNGNPTILPSRLTVATLGQRVGFSDRDITKVNKLYRCDIPGPTSSNQQINVKITTTQAPTTSAAASPATTTKTAPTTSAQSHLTSSNSPVTQSSTVPTTPAVTFPVPTPIPVTHSPLINYQWSIWSSWSPCDLKCTRTRYRFCFNTDPSYCPGPNQEIASCPLPCRVAYPLGCWTYNASLIPSVEGLYSDLTDEYKTRTSSVRKCADSADRNGFMVFSVVNHGECLTGPSAHRTFDNLGTTEDCGDKGDGSSTGMNVYTFQTDIDGEWSPWTEWGLCTRPCDGGVTHRYRHCDSPPPIGNGKQCSGIDREIQYCNKNVCQVDSKCGIKYHTGEAGTSGKINIGDYDNLMECEYQIQSGDPKATISVSVTRMDIEFSASCSFDAIMVFDGPDLNGTLLGAHCGNLLPSSVISTSNSMFLKFTTDETVTGSGFTIAYSINEGSLKSCVQPKLVAHGTVSGSTNFVGDTLFFSCDSGFDLIGPSNITCVDQPFFALWSDVYPYCTKIYTRSVGLKVPILCTFEEDLCGFVQDENDEFDWSIDQNYPDVKQSANTGHYMTSRTTRLNKYGDTAALNSKIYFPDTQGQCLKFRYRLSGRDNSKLAVIFLPVDDISLAAVLWSKDASVSTNDGWEDESLEFTSFESYQIIFVYEVGEEYGSSASVDDVVVRSGNC